MDVDYASLKSGFAQQRRNVLKIKSSQTDSSVCFYHKVSGGYWKDYFTPEACRRFARIQYSAIVRNGYGSILDQINWEFVMLWCGLILLMVWRLFVFDNFKTLGLLLVILFLGGFALLICFHSRPAVLNLKCFDNPLSQGCMKLATSFCCHPRWAQYFEESTCDITSDLNRMRWSEIFKHSWRCFSFFASTRWPGFHWGVPNLTLLYLRDWRPDMNSLSNEVSFLLRQTVIEWGWNLVEFGSEETTSSQFLFSLSFEMKLISLERRSSLETIRIPFLSLTSSSDSWSWACESSGPEWTSTNLPTTS